MVLRILVFVTPVFAPGLIMIPGTILTLDGVFSGAHRHAYMAFSISTSRIYTGFDINCLLAGA
jgi:hypothetical protein